MSIDRNVRTCLHTVHIHILHVLLVFASSISFILFIFNHFNHLLWHRPSAFADVNRSCSLWKSKAQEVEFSLLQADFFVGIFFFSVFLRGMFFLSYFFVGWKQPKGSEFWFGRIFGVAKGWNSWNCLLFRRPMPARAHQSSMVNHVTMLKNLIFFKGFLTHV